MKPRDRLRELLSFLRKPNKSRREKLLIGASAMLLVLLLIPIVTYAYFVRDLESKDAIMNRNNTGVVLLDRHDRPFFTFYEARANNFVPLTEVPRDLQEALIAVEDKDFYDHPGVSLKASLAALYADLGQQELLYGGSTITQQLVKNTLLSHRKSFLRKYQEIVLAAEIDRRYSKKEILEMYLNSVYFGEGAFGVGEAAYAYYGKPVRSLGLAESSLLVGLLTAPSRLSPISGDGVKARERQRMVLQKMLEQKYISPEEKTTAENFPLSFNPSRRNGNFQAPHFALMVQQDLLERYGEERIIRSGFRVRTSLDLDWQSEAERTLESGLARLAGRSASNGSIVVIDPKTAEVRALVGSRDWQNAEFGKINMALSPRQPGSAFKPIVYAAALEEKAITAATVLHDRPTNFGGYRPENFDRGYRGDVLARRALANSLNIPSVEVASKVGTGDSLEMAKRLGVTTLKKESDYGLSLGLGSGEVTLLELTNAYAVFAHAGKGASAVSIGEIRNKRGQKIYRSRAKPEKILDPEVPFLISSILSDNRSRSEVFGNQLATSRGAAVKTGTTDDFKNAWTVGYTPSLAIGVWIGNSDNSPMDSVAGSLGAAPIWRSLMEQLSAGSEEERFKPTAKITTRLICGGNGLLAPRAGPSVYEEYFIRGTEPTKLCSVPELRKESDDEENGDEKKGKKRDEDEEERQKEED